MTAIVVVSVLAWTALAAGGTYLLAGAGGGGPGGGTASPGPQPTSTVSVSPSGNGDGGGTLSHPPGGVAASVVDAATGAGECPLLVELTGVIAADPGTAVRYTWRTHDSRSTGEQSVTTGADGQARVRGRFDFPGTSWQGTVALTVLGAGVQSAPRELALTCAPVITAERDGPVADARVDCSSGIVTDQAYVQFAVRANAGPVTVHYALVEDGAITEGDVEITAPAGGEEYVVYIGPMAPVHEGGRREVTLVAPYPQSTVSLTVDYRVICGG
ncbi:hypothetical protein Afil01_62590 [Actinorhabdospora filicis]|uniref:Uncharacterized protein n=1 Tax=Actinorhabdospora filicis TaxID=1785913 RepID=A0A9W6STB4_9ACTN|nr:hypothetical protein [Actinorhabdospora filicis]GLZ81452.1 hypothetical protein Afil01_62590 [Actinorhabdospora filicis]